MEKFKNIQAHNISHTLIKGCEMIDNPYSHILEFGAASGNTLVQIVDSVHLNKYEIFGFDSWLGLPEDWTIPGEPPWHTKGVFSSNGVIPDQITNLGDKVKIFQGMFEDTIPEYIKIAKNIALLHIDSDLYSSAKTVLYGLKDYIKPGTLIIFDEWIDHQDDVKKLPDFKVPEKYRMHEQRAFYEWTKDFNVKFQLHISEYGYFGLEIEKQLVEILEIN